jgi:alpha-D-ribose 1-methylphosphonate 5-triphosphate synthase subunit PhnG
MEIPAEIAEIRGFDILKGKQKKPKACAAISSALLQYSSQFIEKSVCLNFVYSISLKQFHRAHHIGRSCLDQNLKTAPNSF